MNDDTLTCPYCTHQWGYDCELDRGGECTIQDQCPNCEKPVMYKLHFVRSLSDAEPVPILLSAICDKCGHEFKGSTRFPYFQNEHTPGTRLTSFCPNCFQTNGRSVATGTVVFTWQKAGTK